LRFEILTHVADKVKRPNKAMHDPLAVCAALNPDIIETVQVELYRVVKGSAWGSKPSTNSSTFISIALKDPELFMQTFCCKT
jgi:inosine-uridine nucleoside N-ribohydrolase